MDIVRQVACMVVSPIMVDTFASLFNCTKVGRSSDKMIAPSSFLFSDDALLLMSVVGLIVVLFVVFFC